MRLKIFFYSICCSLISFSQITVTDIHLMDVGDVIFLAEDSSTSLNLGSASQNQTWDFSNLIQMDAYKMSVLSPNGTPYDQQYPNANICIEDEGEFIYCNKSINGVSMLGFGDSIFQEPLLICPFPLSFGASYTDGPLLVLDSLIGGPMVNFLLASQGITASMISFGLAHTADSISIQSEVTTDFNVDADGNVILPIGTFDAVRVRVDRTSDFNISVYCTDTATGMFSDWYSLPFGSGDVESYYQWYSNDPNSKFTLVDIYIDSVGNQDGSVTFLTNSLTSCQEINIDNIEVYPNPTSDVLNISNTVNDLTDVVMMDINGKSIKNLSFIGSIDLDVSNVGSGIFFLQITNDNNSLLKKIIIK
ncbi:MAG: hypothetical protein CMP51_05570 [Flavobacteriales bacterium]|nr:hypothetical protein [Flavobacteriales bacterium]